MSEGIVIEDREDRDVDEAPKTENRDERLRLAEQVCLMVGWTASDTRTERGKARHELWAEWLRAYEAAGESASPKAHPELSEARIHELAQRRDETVARTLAGIAALTEVPSDAR